MQRRGESGQQVKGRPKVRQAPTAHVSTDPSAEQFDHLNRERDEALEQLAAISEVVRTETLNPHILVMKPIRLFALPPIADIRQRASGLCIASAPPHPNQDCYFSNAPSWWSAVSQSSLCQVRIIFPSLNSWISMVWMVIVRFLAGKPMNGAR
jgi:hypothetical protein